MRYFGIYLNFVLIPGRVTLGSGPGVDIPVQGTGVLPLHCHIENNEGVVTLHPIAGNSSVDGIHITASTRLTQGTYIHYVFKLSYL